MSKSKRQRPVNISAREMIEVSLAQAVWDKSPPESRGRPPGIPIGGGFLLHDLAPLWKSIGESFRYKVKGQKLLITPPHVEALQHALEPHLALADQTYTAFKQMLNLQSGYQNTDAFNAFERLDPADQRSALQSLRQRYAAGYVNSLIWAWSESRIRSATAGERAQISRGEFRSYTESHALMREGLLLDGKLLEMVDWSVRSREIQRSQQFLPPGEWLRPATGQEADPTPEDEQLELGQEAIAAEDGRVDASRDAYYMGDLQCLYRLEPQGWFSNRRYIAYIYQAPSKELIALLDCATWGNAAYVFRMGLLAQSDPEAWKADAFETKFELLTRSEDRRGTFERRFIHATGWQERLRQWLEASYPVVI